MGGPRPPADPGADALDLEVSFLERQLPGLLTDARNHPEDAAAQINAHTAARDLALARKRVERRNFEQALKAADEEVDQTVPERFRKRTKELLRTGEFASVAAAKAAARGELINDDYDPQAAEREREALERDRKAREAGKVGSVTGPSFSLSRPENGDKVRLTQAQLDELTRLPTGHPARKQYNEAYKLGQVEIIRQ